MFDLPEWCFNLTVISIKFLVISILLFYKAEYVVVTAILFGFKNLPGLHVQQISIPNCRISITFLIVICHSASAWHPTFFFCLYNIKSKSASYFWLFSHENSARWRKTKLGGTYHMFKINDFPSFWGLVYNIPLFS